MNVQRLEKRVSFCCHTYVHGSSVRRRCGYTVSKVANGSVKLVHETSVKHYKDDLTFTLTDKKVWRGSLPLCFVSCARLRLSVTRIVRRNGKDPGLDTQRFGDVAPCIRSTFYLLSQF